MPPYYESFYSHNNLHYELPLIMGRARILYSGHNSVSQDAVVANAWIILKEDETISSMAINHDNWMASL